MSALLRTEPPCDPYQILKGSIEWGRIEGLYVVSSRAISLSPVHPGIVCESQYARGPWRKDPMARGVTPIGAAILMRQSEGGIEIYDDLDLQASAALEIGIPFCRGVADGLAKEPSGDELERGTTRLYLEGFETGTRLRGVLYDPRARAGR